MGCAVEVMTEYFYPRPPWGGRPYQAVVRHGGKNISIHALRGEGDPASPRNSCSRSYFYPRPPWGGRHGGARHTGVPRQISIHALRGEGDGRCGLERNGDRDFYPRPPWGGRRQKCLKNSCTFVSNHTIGSLIYREILPEPQRNRQNNLCFTPKIRCDSPG